MLPIANTMNEIDFMNQVRHTLQHLAETLEKQLDENNDIDIREGFLQITFASGHVWLLNRHTPTQEIWLSSPVSGGLHFRFQEDVKQWVSTRPSQDELCDFLERELSAFSNSADMTHL